MPRECKRNGNQLSILFREDQFYFFFLLFYFIRKLNERERERENRNFDQGKSLLFSFHA